MSVTLLCSMDDVSDVLSAAGTALSADDGPPSSYGNVLRRGTNTLNLYLSRRYDPANLVGNDIVTEWCAIVSAYRLRTRRGNPPPAGLQIDYERVMFEMGEVKAGRMDIPDAVPRKGYFPTISTMRSTQTPIDRSVVEKSRSTGNPEGYPQQVDPWDRLGANNQGIMDNSL